MERGKRDFMGEMRRGRKKLLEVEIEGPRGRWKELESRIEEVKQRGKGEEIVQRMEEMEWRVEKKEREDRRRNIMNEGLRIEGG